MFFAGLKDVEHKPHSVYIDRYPEGREATVAWPSVDLKFTNTTPYGVLIKADVVKSTPSAEGAATVSMYSTKRVEDHQHATARAPIREAAAACATSRTRTARSSPAPRGSASMSSAPSRPVGSGKVLRKEKFHTDYIAADTVRCGLLQAGRTEAEAEEEAQREEAQPEERHGARALTRILTTVVVVMGVVGASVSARAEAAPSTRSIASVKTGRADRRSVHPSPVG